MAPYRHRRPARSNYNHRTVIPAVMDSYQAVSILEDKWGKDADAWRPHDFPFGASPLQWPPRMVTALAELATAAGPARRELALQMVDRLGADERRDGRLSRTTPEHIHKVTEELKQIPESQNRGTSNPIHDPLTRFQDSTRTVETDNSATHAAASSETTSRETASREIPAHDDTPAAASTSTPIHPPRCALSSSPIPSFDPKKPKLDPTAKSHPPTDSPPPTVHQAAESDDQPSPAKDAQESSNTTAKNDHDHDAPSLRTQLASTQHKLTRTQQLLETLTLELALTNTALAAAKADASAWRAVEPGYRHCLAENMRLSRAALRVDKAEALVVALRRQLKEVEAAYARLEAEKVDVWGDADGVLPGVVRERDGLRRGCEVLSGEVEKLKKGGA